ncbi:MAG: type II/IV secretion system ATPase subunit, partial [Methanoregulaceae archaeon]|nr:type II/IV secretion system ATPase subunit [Methanoregulaceae archaeon]
EEINDYMRDTLVYDRVEGTEGRVLDEEAVRRGAEQFVPGYPEERIPVLLYYLMRNLQGYGPVDPLMHDPGIEDISCNGPELPVYIYHTRFGSIPTSVSFIPGDLNRYILKLAQKADKQISIASPLLDAPLQDGSRVQMTYTDVVSSRGSSFTIRRFKKEPMTPVDLINYGTYSPEILAFIWLAVEHRKSMIVVGGTASGKTSTMNAISNFIPLTSKIVSLEDTREIQLPHRNWLPTKTRDTQGSSTKGDIDLFSLLKASLRQRPEYIIVGEVRGGEAQTLFQAMNTGHTTYSTLHAGSEEESINRLINPPINVPRSMFGALDLMVVQLLQYRKGRAVRRCRVLSEISVDRSDVIRCCPLYQWNPVTDRFERLFSRSKVLDSIAYSRGWTRETAEEQLSARAHMLGQMARHRVTRGEEITRLFNLMRLVDRSSADENGETGHADG